MAQIDNYPYTEQDLKGTSAPFDWTYVLWRKNLIENFKKVIIE